METVGKQLGKRGRDLGAILTILLVLFCLGGCEGEAPSTESSDREVDPNDSSINQSTPTDTSDPEAVAKALINALVNNDAQEAAKYVIPEERDEVKKAMEEGIPPLPENPEIIVEVKRDGIRTDVSVLNITASSPDGPPFGLDMKPSMGNGGL